MTIGAGVNEHGVDIKGIAGLLITLAPETAIEAHAKRTAEGESCTVADIASALTGIDDARGHIIVLGPNWAGDMAAWFTPEEAAKAVRKVLGGENADDIWSHVNRGAIRLLEESYDPIPKAKSAAARRVAETEGTLNTPRIDKLAYTEASRLAREYPPSHVDTMARTHPDARVDDGRVIGMACTVGPGSHIGPNVRLGAGTNVGSNVRIHARTTTGKGIRIEEGTTIGHDCRIGGETVIGTWARVGPHVSSELCGAIGKRATIGEQVLIGRGTQVGEGAGIGAGTRIGDGAVVAPGLRIGSRCLIGARAHAAGADMPERTTVAKGLKITTAAEMARYAVEMTAPAAPAAPRAQGSPA